MYIYTALSGSKVEGNVRKIDSSLIELEIKSIKLYNSFGHQVRLGRVPYCLSLLELVLKSREIWQGDLSDGEGNRY